MLNLTVGMLKNVITSLFVLVVAISPSITDSSGLEIISPAQGQVVQGNVEITGSISADGFQSAEMAYAYTGSETATWFVINSISRPVNNGVLTVWDTSSISDGDYRLKLSVKRQNGENQELIVNSILVRNYTAVVATPSATADQSETISEMVTATVLSTVVKTQAQDATPFPSNNAALTTQKVTQNLKNGFIIGLVCILALGAYFFFRGWLRRR